MRVGRLRILVGGDGLQVLLGRRRMCRFPIRFGIVFLAAGDGVQQDNVGYAGFRDFRCHVNRLLGVLNDAVQAVQPDKLH